MHVWTLVPNNDYQHLNGSANPELHSYDYQRYTIQKQFTVMLKFVYTCVFHSGTQHKKRQWVCSYYKVRIGELLQASIQYHAHMYWTAP